MSFEFNGRTFKTRTWRVRDLLAFQSIQLELHELQSSDPADFSKQLSAFDKVVEFLAGITGEPRDAFLDMTPDELVQFENALIQASNLPKAQTGAAQSASSPASSTPATPPSTA